MLTLLAPQTAAGQSVKVAAQDDEALLFLIHAAAGLTVNEHADLQVSHDGGASWQDVFNGSTQQRLNTTNTTLKVEGPGTYRIDKDASTNAVGVYCAIRGNV